MMRFVFALALALAATLAACSEKVPEMTPEEVKRVEQIVTRPTTRCIGRYLVDLPEAFTLNSEAKGADVEGVNIVEVKRMSKSMFEYALKEKEADLKGTKFIGKRSDLPFLRLIKPLPSPSLGVLIDRAESRTTSRLSRTLEILGWRDGYMIAAFINATDNTFPEDANDSIAQQLGNDTPQKLAHLLKVFERVRGRSEEEIPTEQGLCFPNGFVAGPAIEEEVVGYLFDLKGSPDVYFSFTESGNLHEESTMLQRSSKIEAEMKQGGAKTLRKGKRTIHDLPYEEWLMAGPTPDRVPGTMLQLLGNEVAEGAEKPFVEFELYNGYRIVQPTKLTDKQMEERGLYKELERASLSDAEAVAIWDAVTPTLRIRPSAF